MVIGDLGKIVEERDVCELFFGSKKDFDNLSFFFLGRACFTPNYVKIE